MRRIKVDYSTNEIDRMLGNYNYGGLKIAICSKPKNYRVKPLTSFDSCREILTSRLREVFTGPVTNALRKADKNRLRLLAVLRNLSKDQSKELKEKRKAKVDESLQIGIKLLNHFEKRHGWGVTKMYETDNNGQFVKDKIDKNDCTHVYMVVSSKKWIKSPATTSLHGLILRLGFSGFKEKFDTHEELMEALFKHGKSTNRNAKDRHNVLSTYEKWDVLLGNLDRIYAGRTAENIHCPKSLSGGGEGSWEGILQLCHGNSADIIAADRFQKLCEERGLEQESVMRKNLEKSGILKKELNRLEKRRKKAYEADKS